MRLQIPEANYLNLQNIPDADAEHIPLPQLRAMVVKVAIAIAGGFDLAPPVLDRLSDLALTTQYGLFVAPIDLPGTAWRKSRKARVVYSGILADAIRARFGVDRETGGIRIPEALLAVDAAASPPGSLDSMLALIQEFVEMGVGCMLSEWAGPVMWGAALPGKEMA